MEHPNIVVIGMGYVGLPLAVACAEAGRNVTGLDIDPERVRALDARWIADADCVVVLTDHAAVDHALRGQHARALVDTRNRVCGPEAR